MISSNGGAIHSNKRTQAAVRPLSQSEVSLPAVVAALALHVGFAPTLAWDQPGGHIGPRVAESALQRPGRVTVARCREVNANHSHILRSRESTLKRDFFHEILETKRVLKYWYLKASDTFYSNLSKCVKTQENVKDFQKFNEFWQVNK